MNLKSRLAQLEKQKPADVQIRVFIVDDDGSAYSTDAAGKRTDYTAAQFEQHRRDCDARGELVILVETV